jgi:hypothetical protein
MTVGAAQAIHGTNSLKGETPRPSSTPVYQPLNGSPVDAIVEMLMLIDGTTKGLPDQSKMPPDPDIDITPTQALPDPQTPRESTGTPVAQPTREERPAARFARLRGSQGAPQDQAAAGLIAAGIWHLLILF